MHAPPPLAVAAIVGVALAGCDGGSKVTLRYRPQAGATYHYALEQQSSLKVETGPMAQLPGQDITVRIYYTHAVTGPTTGGIAVTVTYDSTSMDPSTMAPALDRMRGVKSNVVYDERMRVVSTRLAGVAGEPSPLVEQLERSVKATAFPLPEEAVGVGDSWTAENEMPLGQALGASVPLKSRSKRTVRKIQVVGADTSVLVAVETTFPGDPVTVSQRGQTATVQLSGAITGEEIFSLAKSTVVRATAGGTMRINVQGSEGMTMAMTQQTSLQLAP
jgi:hypothetical protein